MSKTNQNPHRCNFKPFGERECGRPANWVAMDGNEVVAVACDPHSDELIGDPGIRECASWFKLVGTAN